MIRISRLLLAVGLLTAAACEDPGGSGERTPARLDVISGDLQSDTVGKEIAQPLVVRVVDDRDRPVRNRLVNFVVTTGGGSVLAGSAVTDADGEARERWTLGTVAGDTQRVEARVMDASTGQPIVLGTARAVGVPDAPAAASAVGATSRAGAAGTAVADSLSVRVVDKHGNGVPGVAVALAPGNGGSVSPATATTRADGIARAQWTLGPTAGPQTATATAPGLGAVTFTAAAAVGPVARVVLTPETLSFSALQQTQALTVQAYDAFGNMVGGQQATIISQNASVVALDDGAVARATGNGTARVIATVQGSTAADTTTATVQQVATSVVVTPTTATRWPGQTVQFSASAYDAGGALVTNPGFSYASNSAAVTVNGTGLATVVSPAEGATITVSTGGASATATLAVKSVPRVSQVSVGRESACAVREDGKAFCWGSDSWGELGDGPASQEKMCNWGWACVPTPVAVSGGLTFRQVEVGRDHVCGLTTGGAAYCWGTGRYGGLGNGGTSDTPSPVAVSGGHTFVQIAVGSWFACGRTAQGQAWCWGYAYQGRLGNGGAFTHTSGEEGYNPVPVQVNGGLAFTDLTAGDGHACGIAAGRAYCWGANGSGQLGNSTRNPHAEPVAVEGGLSFKDVGAGAYTTCGVTEEGGAYCWGSNGSGGVGIDTTYTYWATPTRVLPNVAMDAISTGGGRTCAVAVDGRAFCWGLNPMPKRTIFDSSPRFQAGGPAAVPGASLFSAVASGHYSSCGIDTAGRLRCWNSNVYGLLGNDSQQDSAEPVYVHVPSS